MEFSVREELTILTIIFGFCIFSISLVIIKDNLDEHKPSEAKSLSDFEFSKKVLVHSVGILQSISSGNDSQFELSDLMEIKEKEFTARFPRISFDFEDQKVWTEAWEEFDFESGTVLTSNSFLLPLKVDWCVIQTYSEGKYFQI